MRLLCLVVLAAGTAYGVSEAGNPRSAPVVERPVLKTVKMPIDGVTDAPIGYSRFCASNQSECRATSGGEKEVMLTEQRWSELRRVNNGVNERIKPVSDEAQYKVIEYWTYPTTGKGDCEDYVLLKKRELVALGWPAGALLITVVRDENDEGHAVLTARTDRGEFILDNKHSMIMDWRDTDYTYIKRQSSLDPRHWESLVPQRTDPTVAASGAEGAH
jgi:predicted transglutaminase-like cysteine proteinase